MKKGDIIHYLILGLVLIIVWTALYLVATRTRYTQVPVPVVESTPIDEEAIFTATSSPEGSTSTPSYSYLFDSTRQENTSNIVGYFAHGAFAWYVPDWLVQNWTMDGSETTGMNMTFVPNITGSSTEDVSPITFAIGTSTEQFNAATLYDKEIREIDPSRLLLNEVLLNKHTEGGITLIIETDTRIYHIQEMMGNNIEDIYFMDGNGKTLIISFNAKASVFPQFTEKIRDMVEGIGEVKPPQG